MNLKKIRWQQRFQNYEKAFLLLERTVNKANLSSIERAGLVHFFKLTLNLSGKVIKDCLKSKNIIANSPKEVITKTYQARVITSKSEWLNALKSRNLTAHIYNEKILQTIEKDVRNAYFPIFKHFYKSQAKLI